MLFLIQLVLGLNLVHAGPTAIYGKDDRKEVYEGSALQERLSLSTAVQISPKSLFPKPEYMEIFHLNMGEAQKLCPRERFIGQIEAGECSGFLIAPDLIATAGHCVTEDSCKNFKWVFDYRQDQPRTNYKTSVRTQVPLTSVYGCQEIVRKKEGLFKDIAVIRLDRPVTDRLPLVLSMERLKNDQTLFMIGYPSGLPAKVADNARVLRQNKFKFVTDLDGFGGNSGSAVFNADSGEVVGVFVSGRSDFFQSNSGCFRSSMHGTDGGEKVSKIGQLNLHDLTE